MENGLDVFGCMFISPLFGSKLFIFPIVSSPNKHLTVLRIKCMCCTYQRHNTSKYLDAAKLCIVGSCLLAYCLWKQQISIIITGHLQGRIYFRTNRYNNEQMIQLLWIKYRNNNHIVLGIMYFMDYGLFLISSTDTITRISEHRRQFKHHPHSA